MTIIASTSEERIEIVFDLLTACGAGDYTSEKLAELASVAEIQQVTSYCEEIAMERLADKLFETNPCVFQADTVVH
jgi:mannitol/fructose-specific phosphotransferase system IIA component